MKVDRITESWIRNKSDEFAVEQGCVFDQYRADHVLWFFENRLTLFQGKRQPFVPIPAARDMLSRVFGWVKRNEEGKWVRRFTKAFWWVPKKSGKSPIAAGVMLYLLMMDGEYGQNVYCTAKDGKQANIVYEHAVKMGMKSDWLRPYLKQNKTEHWLEYADFDSKLKRVSGDNPDSQHGLNGSCIVDELHVVTSELYEVLSEMGASRDQPLMFHVSTFGADLDSIGKYLYDQGKLVVSGVEKNISVFHESFELPAGISDAELKLPDGISDEELQRRLQPWIAANPGWGITIKPERFINDLRAVQRSTARFAKFKMLRGNQWQVGDNPALDPDAWERCKREWAWTSLSVTAGA